MPDKQASILVVDDEPDISSVLDLRLRSAGYAVMIAANGQEALAQIKAKIPDLIISDVMMPDMDGFAFYKELKKSSLTKDIPVIILTARGKMEGTFEAVGADEFLVKPFDAKILLEKVEALLARQVKVASVERGKKILLAGSDNEVLENMSKQLTRLGCLVDVVTTGAQVISKTVLFIPALMILEVQMDGISSGEVVQIVRKLPQSEKIPILTYSYYRLSDLGTEDVRQKALTVDAAVEGCLSAGATEHLGRFNENTFIRQLSKFL